jgi:cell wall-associated NlpC family hydrolase
MRILLAAAAALIVAPAALAATPAAEIRGPDGGLIAAASRAPFAYGTALEIGSMASTARGLELRDVSLLGGTLKARRLVVPARGLGGARIDGLAVGGRHEPGNTNTLLSLGGSSYVVVLQEAVVPGSAPAVVGLRVYVGEAQQGLPAGSQILVGLARATVAPPQTDEAKTQPWRVLGVVPAVAASAPALPGIPDPFAGMQASSPIGVRAVSLAERFIGVPYVWGGADPAGFDCSGLVMFVYHQLGIGLPHFSGSQWYSGTRISADDLRAGDLVFFDMGPSGPGHVGLYAGDGKFIEAPHHNAAVRISSLIDPARGLSFVGAVRPHLPD